MSSSLGYRLGCDSVPRIKSSSASLPAPVPAPDVPSKRSMPTKLSVPKGFVPATLYSLFFLMFPMLSTYTTFDFTDAWIQAGTIASSALVAIILVSANDCVAWFNMGLAFHIGIEVGVLDTVAQYALASNTPTEGTVLAWVAFGVIVAHLLPFLFVDRSSLLTLLAFAGIIVNTSALVFIAPSMLLQTALSASLLLGLVLLVACIDCVNTSLMSQLRQAMKEGTWFLCLPYEF